VVEPIDLRATDDTPPPAPQRATNRGPGRLLIAVYILFAIAATSRAGLQIATKFDEAPVAYLLSAVAAVIYIVAAVGLARAGHTGRRVALACCSVELVGVVAVGVLSLADRALFPDETVWSDFGSGYGYIPLVLPMLGLFWLWRTRRDPA
jgi:cytochrome bd-type quinol oxidase subunit 2